MSGEKYLTRSYYPKTYGVTKWHEEHDETVEYPDVPDSRISCRECIYSTAIDCPECKEEVGVCLLYGEPINLDQLFEPEDCGDFKVS